MPNKGKSYPGKSSRAFADHFIEAIRDMRTRDSEYNIMPSMNECLDILHTAVSSFCEEREGKAFNDSKIVWADATTACKRCKRTRQNYEYASFEDWKKQNA